VKLVMDESEASLLKRFQGGGDIDAFAQITRLYADMVYGTCVRITGDREAAADATQDTFFALLKSAGKVTGSLGGWLHRVATRRAIDLVRLDCSRRRREQGYAAQMALETDRWADVSPLLDEAMNEIDEAARDLILRHFLQRQTTVEIAAAQGVAQSTVSRHLEQALAQLRDKLRGKGVLVAVAVLGGLLGQAVEAAPPAVLAELNRIAVVGSATAAGGAGAVALGGLNAVLLALGIAGLSGVLWLVLGPDQPVASTKPARPSIPAQGGGSPINLTAYCNARLNQDWHDLSGPRNDLAELPTGVQTFAGTAFNVRGIVQVKRQARDYPAAVNGIRIGQACRRLHFLHAAINAASTADGTEIGRYVVHYASGERRAIPIVIGRDVVDWFEQPREGGKPLLVAWTGENPKSRRWGKKIRLFKGTWENPLPQTTVASVDFLALKPGPSPFLIALTAE